MTRADTEAQKAARKALERAQTRTAEASEADIQGDIQTALRALGFDPDLESPLISPATGTSKRADILCAPHRLILECKARDKLDNLEQPSQQFSQLAGYVESFRRKPEIPDSPLRYAGILTDGRVWFLWTWPASEKDAPPVHIHQLQPERTWRGDGDLDGVLEWLSARSQSRDSPKDQPPAHLQSIFIGGYASEDLWKLWCGQGGTPSARTHYAIWSRFMEDSGFLEAKEATDGDDSGGGPSGTDSSDNSGGPGGASGETISEERKKKERLFIDHCWLVLIARSVINALESPQHPVDDDVSVGDEQLRLSRLTEGFVHWITETQGGKDFLRSLQSKIDTYDWRQRPRDILKDLYESLIDKKNRKVFGEYYTPDWLAEMLAERILDDTWCKNATLKALQVCKSGVSPDTLRGIGVLDPACGSGTFLLHAARRILTTSTLEGESAETCANVVARLVHGFDVHPIAVELARATLLQALPARPSETTPIQVYQGDALVRDWGTGADTGFVPSPDRQEKVRTIQTREKRNFRLPQAFFEQQGFQSHLRTFVKTAHRASKNERPPESFFPHQAIHDAFKPEEKEQLREAWYALVEICRSEGNGIWEYHIRNFWAPALLGDAKIDRILTNPPWVCMNEIQTRNRKNTFEKMAAELKIWVGRNQATKLDIASIFILQCMANFFIRDKDPTKGLTKNPPRGAWVTNNSSIKAGNWENFREQMQDNSGEKQERRHWTLSTAQIREAPFQGASAAVWFTGQPGEDYILTMKKKDRKGKINRDDSWKKVQDKLEWIRASTQEPIFPWGAPAPRTMS